MSRTPIFAALRRAFALAAITKQANAPGLDELVEMPRRPMLRRRAVVAGLAASVATVSGGLRIAAARADTRIAIVGAGLAGLAAAHRLVAGGARSVTVYEANTRLGGRMISARGVLGAGVVAELGGSFINTEHADILALCSELGLVLEDGAAGGDGPGAAYYIGGRHRSIAEIAGEAAGLLAQMETLRGLADKAATDLRPAAEWLDRFGCSGWLRTLLDVGLTQEMGLEPDRISGLYLSESFAPDPREPARGLFSSDQRFQVEGGNDRLPAALAARLDGRIRRGHRLESIRPRGRSVALGFMRDGVAIEAVADLVILALPASTLRRVDMRLDVPPRTLRAIRELTYGTNAKLLAGLDRRPWRAAGMSGECLNDLGIQAVWEDHARPGAAAGSMTIFAGGRAGVGFGGSTPVVERVSDALAQIDVALPGAAAAFNRRATVMHWPSNPHVRGSYSCFAPGQWTGFAGAFAPAGPVIFAGEHTSEAFSGYMNGAAESGRLAAEAAALALA